MLNNQTCVQNFLFITEKKLNEAKQNGIAAGLASTTSPVVIL